MAENLSATCAHEKISAAADDTVGRVGIDCPIHISASVASRIHAGCQIITIVAGGNASHATIRAEMISALHDKGIRLLSAEGSAATPAHLQHLIAGAVGVPTEDMGAGIVPEPRKVLEVVAMSNRADRLALLIDDAQSVGAVALCYLWLMVGLFDFGKTKLHVVLMGGDGRWDGWEHPSCAELRQAAVGYRFRSKVVAEASGTAKFKVANGFENAAARQPARSAVSVRPTQQPGSPISRQRVRFGMSLTVAGICLLAPTTTWRSIERPDQQPLTVAMMPEPALVAPSFADIEEARTAALLPPAIVPGAPHEDVTQVPPTPSSSDAVDAALTQTVGDTVATNRALQDDALQGGRVRHGSPGLVLLAQAGDTLQQLYAKVYQGRTPPPYADIVAANPGRFTAGILVVFPAPPEGWTNR